MALVNVFFQTKMPLNRRQREGKREIHVICIFLEEKRLNKRREKKKGKRKKKEKSKENGKEKREKSEEGRPSARDKGGERESSQEKRRTATISHHVQPRAVVVTAGVDFAR